MPIYPPYLQVNTAIYICPSISPSISPFPEIGLVSLPDKLHDLINLIMHIAKKPPNNCKIIAVFTCNYELFAFLTTTATIIATTRAATRAANMFGILIIIHFVQFNTLLRGYID